MINKKLPLKILATVALSSLFLTACNSSHVRGGVSIGTGHHGGYLTHTPYNHRLSYNSALGLYTVIGLSNTYYNNGHYYRYNGSHWHRSRDYRAWSILTTKAVPSRLYARHYKPARRYGRVGTTRPQRANTGRHTRWVYPGGRR